MVGGEKDFQIAGMQDQAAFTKWIRTTFEEGYLFWFRRKKLMSLRNKMIGMNLGPKVIKTETSPEDM